ncbi:MAG: TerC family protein [Verrucomicrobiales bacterium]
MLTPFLHPLALNLVSVPGVAWLYVGVVLLVISFLALDLGVFHRNAHVVSMREAFRWTVVWVSCALLFVIGVYFIYENQWLGVGHDVKQLGGAVRDVAGKEAAQLFLTGYVIEYSLSMDNVFIIAIIFGYFGTPAVYQHRVLFWGILGALAMRGAMIFAGAALITSFSWIIYVFGGFLIITAIKLALSKDEALDLEKNAVVRIVRRFLPISPHYDGQRFFTRLDGKLAATPLFLALAVVECTDLIFAVDSVPAIFAVTADPFLVFTSNIFAIMGLRSLYFLLANLIHRFRYLKPALICILLFVGVKMLLVHTALKIPPGLALGVVVAILTSAVVASLMHRSGSEELKPRQIDKPGKTLP